MVDPGMAPDEPTADTAHGHNNQEIVVEREKQSPPQYARVIRRIARIWSGVVIVVGVLIFMGEIFESRSLELDTYPIYENLIPLALLMALLGLALAWKWERLGGTITIIAVFAANLVYWVTGREARLVVFLVLLPVLIPGLLFLISWRIRNRSSGD